MSYTALWLSAHRNLLLALVGFSLWMFANYWYLRRDIKKWRRNARGHSWTADMATKRSKGGQGPSA